MSGPEFGRLGLVCVRSKLRRGADHPAGAGNLLFLDAYMMRPAQVLSNRMILHVEEKHNAMPECEFSESTTGRFDRGRTGVDDRLPEFSEWTGLAPWCGTVSGLNPGLVLFFARFSRNGSGGRIDGFDLTDTTHDGAWPCVIALDVEQPNRAGIEPVRPARRSKNASC